MSVFLLAHYLGAELFGRYAIALAIPTAVEPLADLGLSQALVRAGAGRPARAKALAVAAIRPKLALAAVIVALTYLVSVWLGLPDEILEAALYLALARSLESLTLLARAVFQAHERMDYESALLSFDSVLRLVFVGYAVVSGFGLIGLAKALALAAAVVMIATVAVAARTFLLPGASETGAKVSDMLADGLPLAVVWLLDVLVIRLGIVLVGALQGDAAAGTAAAAARLVEPMLIVPTMMAAALLPLTSRHLIEQRETLPWLLHASMKMSLSVAVLSSLILAGLATMIVEVVFGAEFGSAVVVVQALAFALIPMYVHVLLVAFLLAFREQGRLILSQLIGLALNLALLLAFSGPLGPLAVAIAVIAGEVVTVTAALVLVPRLRELGVIGSLSVAALVVPGGALLLLSPVIGAIGATALSVLAVIGLIRYLRLVHPREITYLSDSAPYLGRVSRLLLAPIPAK